MVKFIILVAGIFLPQQLRSSKVHFRKSFIGIIVAIIISQHNTHKSLLLVISQIVIMTKQIIIFLRSGAKSVTQVASTKS